MEIIVHGHHSAVSESMRERAAAGVRRLAARMDRAVDASVRFEEDGPTRRVEIILHAPRNRRLVAKSEGRFYGPAIAAALAKLETQISEARKMAKAKAKRAAARRRTTTA
jgi:ribosome-associated translation inhibitor RaiA